MIIHADELANLVLKKSLRECSIEELEQLIEQYPYFGPAHLLLTKKLQEDHSPQYEPQVQNTSLYFQNRVWLHHLLNDNNSTDAVIEKNEVPAIAEEQKQTAEPIIIKAKEEPITEAIEEKIAEQPAPDVEIPIEKPESMVATFASENNEVPLAPEPQQEETKETIMPVEGLTLRIEPISADTPLLFEPYHTVDYFASQGIKFKEEDKPRDRFSAQLRSFTEWLKTMKKIPVSEIIATTDAGTEKKVEQMAEYSLAERHVITEAMAEVWKKQGNKARAEDIYNKLSLLDPSKSSYFAAKIEELKKTS
jgi:hypothetical protein